MLSFLFYLLSHEPVEKQRLCTIYSQLILSPFLPTVIQWTIFLPALAFFLFHAASTQQRSGTWTMLSFAWIISWLLLELGIEAHVRKSIHVQGRDQEGDYTGTPMTETSDYRPWILRYLMKIFVYSLAINSIAKTSQQKFS